MCQPPQRGPHMRLQTKFLRLKFPVAVGSYFGDWRVTWAGGWTRHRLSYLVMVVRIERRAERKTSAIVVPGRKGVRGGSS